VFVWDGSDNLHTVSGCGGDLSFGATRDGRRVACGPRRAWDVRSCDVCLADRLAQRRNFESVEYAALEWVRSGGRPPSL